MHILKKLIDVKIFLPIVAVISILGVACASGISADEAAAKDQEIARLRADVNEAQGQLAVLQQDSTYWQQLMGLLDPVSLPSMTDHRAYMLPDGTVMALHFDSMQLDQAENLNWVALGIPGQFCKSDQERVEAEFGKGFTHFHDMQNDIHGGAPNAEGVWFVHVAARDFDAPWGPVRQGIDHQFMPTAPPDC